MGLDDLIKRLPPPSNPTEVPTEGDWARAESALGIALPDEYKGFIGTYGSGRVDDFAAVLGPAARGRYNLLEAWREYREVIGEMNDGPAPLSYGSHPATPGLLPIVVTDNGDVWFLLTGDNGPWRVAVFKSRAMDVDVHEGGLIGFLQNAIKNDLGVLPANQPHVFRPRTVKGG